jgi:hypothetical protein
MYLKFYFIYKRLNGIYVLGSNQWFISWSQQGQSTRFEQHCWWTSWCRSWLCQRQSSRSWTCCFERSQQTKSNALIWSNNHKLWFLNIIQLVLFSFFGYCWCVFLSFMYYRSRSFVKIFVHSIICILCAF